MKKHIRIVATTLFFIVSSALAETTPSGFNIAKCTKCHNEKPDGGFYQFPRLAGQTVKYLISSTLSYKNYKRHTIAAKRLMSKRVQLDLQTITELANYFNKLPPSPGIPTDDPALLAQGKDIYENGIEDKDILSCASCHGKKGEGKVKNLNARLAGQYRGYLWVQTRSYRDGEIEDAAEMSDAVKGISENEMKAVATYLQSL